jgi:hypothetical protein
MLSTIRNYSISLAIILIAILIGFVSTATAQEKDDDLRSKVQNPVASMYSLPLKSTWDFGADNGDAYVLNIQPVIPVTIGSINYINRIIVPIADVPGGVPVNPEIPQPVPGDGASGFGDINYSLFLSPADPGKAIWGIGPSINFPTASDDQLGTDKWSAGPTGVVLFQPGWGTIGGLVRQLWSFAGDDDRSHVNQMLIEPFLNYNLPGGWYLISDIIITANWDAPSSQRWTVPLGGGVGKLFKIGNQPINCRLEAYYNIEAPDTAPDWSTSFTIQFLFPK